MAMTRDFDLLWGFDKPTETEAKFRSMLEKSPDDAYRQELLTQIARCQGLQRKFDEAHATLDKVLAPNKDRTQVRSLLERGRVFNSSGDKEKARPLFVEAWDLANQLHEDFFAVDAAHMIAIVADTKEAMEWNLKALDLAEKSEDERARNWLGSLYNNIGWTYHSEGSFAEALKMFEKALEFRVKQGKRENILIARWCIGRCLRSLGRVDEALEIQRELLETRELNREPDGFVNEEMGECLLALGKTEESKQHFAAAYAQLSQDQWLMSNEAARIDRLKTLSI